MVSGNRVDARVLQDDQAGAIGGGLRFPAVAGPDDLTLMNVTVAGNAIISSSSTAETGAAASA
ncbi:MAG TPA: hypothetical protein VGB19_11155 [Actinomycetota bacterium]